MLDTHNKTVAGRRRKLSFRLQHKSQLSKTNQSNNKLLSSVASGGVRRIQHEISKAMKIKSKFIKKIKISNVHELLSTQT